MSKRNTRRPSGDRDPYKAREAKKYANPIPSREFIISLMEEHGAPLRFDDIAEALTLADPQQQDALSRRLNAMARDVVECALWSVMARWSVTGAVATASSTTRT